MGLRGRPLRFLRQCKPPTGRAAIRELVRRAYNGHERKESIRCVANTVYLLVVLAKR